MTDTPHIMYNEVDMNPLLFLSEQLIHLEGSSSHPSSNTNTAHVSDDDGSPPPTFVFSSTSGDNHHIDNNNLLRKVHFFETETHLETTTPQITSNSTTSTTSTSTTSPHPQFSSSTATAASLTETNDIGPFVHKAKRAAASLWMVLHAQECRFGGDKCPLQGCLEMKSLLLHVKHCVSKATDSPCPERIPGCTQTRKLLAHYRRCREIRASSSSSYSRLSNTCHSCLICTLLARHARNVMESTAAASTLASIGFNRNHSMTDGHTDSLIRSVSMPPPPPRPRTCSLGSMPSLLGSTALAQIVPLPQHSSSKGRLPPTVTPMTRSYHHGRPRATSLDERQGTRYYSNHAFNDPTQEFRIRGSMNEAMREEHLLSTIEESE